MDTPADTPKKIPRAEALRLLNNADIKPGPNTGSMSNLEVWLTCDGCPQVLFHAGSRDYFWLHEVLDAIK